MFDFVYITPEQAAALDDRHTAAQWRKLARKRGTCLCCDNPAWTWCGLGMCFACTTGETDASEDYEVGV